MLWTLEYGWKGLRCSVEAEQLKGVCCTEPSSAHSYGQKSPSLRTQTYFRLSLVIFGGTSDSRKYVCVRRLEIALIWRLGTPAFDQRVIDS